MCSGTNIPKITAGTIRLSPLQLCIQQHTTLDSPWARQEYFYTFHRNCLRGVKHNSVHKALRYITEEFGANITILLLQSTQTHFLEAVPTNEPEITGTGVCREEQRDMKLFRRMRSH